MTRMLAFGDASAAAFARSRTIDALVLNKSVDWLVNASAVTESIPSRVIPGFRGTPAGIKTTSAPLSASLRPEAVGSYPVTVLFVLI